MLLLEKFKTKLYQNILQYLIEITQFLTFLVTFEGY